MILPLLLGLLTGVPLRLITAVYTRVVVAAIKWVVIHAFPPRPANQSLKQQQPEREIKYRLPQLAELNIR